MGYDLPKEYWGTVAKDVVDWTGEQADFLVEAWDTGLKESGSGARRAYMAAKRRQRELQRKGRKARTGQNIDQ